VTPRGSSSSPRRYRGGCARPTRQLGPYRRRATNTNSRPGRSGASRTSSTT
jgi:hypothetical protein